MANNINNPCKVITGKCRLSYAHIWEPSSMDEKSPKKYSACIIWPKNDTAQTRKVEAAMEAATQDGIKAKWKGKKPPKLKLPMRDGDEERPEDEAFQGCWFLNANSSKQPGVVDLARNAIMDQDEIYSGCYGSSEGKGRRAKRHDGRHPGQAEKIQGYGGLTTVFWSICGGTLIERTRSPRRI